MRCSLEFETRPRIVFRQFRRLAGDLRGELTAVSSRGRHAESSFAIRHHFAGSTPSRRNPNTYQRAVSGIRGHEMGERNMQLISRLTLRFARRRSVPAMRY